MQRLFIIKQARDIINGIVIETDDIESPKEATIAKRVQALAKKTFLTHEALGDNHVFGDKRRRIYHPDIFNLPIGTIAEIWRADDGRWEIAAKDKGGYGVCYIPPLTNCPVCGALIHTGQIKAKEE